MRQSIRWGILGTGWIARKFAKALGFLPEAELVAVGSRTSASASEFGDKFDVPHRHASYSALVDDPAVDVVYIATPHPMHKENSLLALGAGKAVLCEKPLAVNSGEAEDVTQYARDRGLFLMEAMWTRFVPIMHTLRQLLEEEVIGDVLIAAADLGFHNEFDPQHRLFNLALAGGALLDVGVYPVSLVSMVFGTPTRVTSMAHLGETGVDEQQAMILGYERGQLAVLFSAITTETPKEITLMGTEGRIRINTPMYIPTKLTLSLPGQEDRIIEEPIEGNGYNYEAAEVMRCLRAGELESGIMPLNETLTIMRTLDQIRAQWGLRYPME